MTPDEFLSWLVTSNVVLIVFEACRITGNKGHDARLISAKLVSAVRQNQKTDKNDALAIVQASLLPEIRFISGKSVKQQQLQSIKRLRELAIKHRDALKKQIVALLLELNIRVPNGSARLINKIDYILEDAENELSIEFRKALHVAQQQLNAAMKSVLIYDDCSEKSIQAHPECKKL
jgi:transposase